MLSIDRALAIDGWMRPTELLWLAQRSQHAQVVFEIGSYLGRSTRALCDHCPGIVYSIDPYPGYTYYNDGSIEYPCHELERKKFYENLHDHLKTGKLVHYRTKFRDFPKDILADFIFIDGDHRYDAVKEDIWTAIYSCKEGGIISGHDYAVSNWPGVKQAVDETFESVKFKDTIWWVNR